MLAAGAGLRFGAQVSKPLNKINSKPVIIYCLEALNAHPGIKNIILVANPANSKGLIAKIRQYRINKISDVVLGGRLRQDSVMNGLKAVPADADLVLIHDGARPFITREMISAALFAAAKDGAAIAAVPVKATVKEVTGHKSQVTSLVIVKRTLERNNLWEAQTPQAFKRELILEAYRRFADTPVTDDAALVEKLGAKVAVVRGAYFNLKITTPEDLVIAQAIAKIQKL